MTFKLFFWTWCFLSKTFPIYYQILNVERKVNLWPKSLNLKKSKLNTPYDDTMTRVFCMENGKSKAHKCIWYLCKSLYWRSTLKTYNLTFKAIQTNIIGESLLYKNKGRFSMEWLKGNFRQSFDFLIVNKSFVGKFVRKWEPIKLFRPVPC
jgi:hypothetical protein